MLLGQPNQLPEKVPSTIEDVNLSKTRQILGEVQGRAVDEIAYGISEGSWEAPQPQQRSERNNTEPRILCSYQGGGIKQRAVEARNSRAVDPSERCRGIREVRLRAGKSYSERPVAHLNPLELSCDRLAQESGTITQRPCSRVSTQTYWSSCTRTNSRNCNG